MKKSIIAIIVFAISISFINSSSAQSDDLAVIEKSLNVKKLKEYLIKDEAGEVLPMIVVSNDKFSESLAIDFDGKKVNVYKDEKDIDLIYDHAFVDVKKFRIRGNLSILKFNYQDYKVKIKFRKINGEWTYQSFNIKGNGDRYIHIDSTF